MSPVLRQWFLHLAIDFPIGLRLLRPLLDGLDCKSYALNVRPLRGFTMADGVACLVELAENGLIIFRHDTESVWAHISPQAVMSLMSHPGAERQLLFELTDAGGKAWESVAEPRWNEMVDGFATSRDENGESVGFEWTYFSQSRERLMADLGWFSMLHEEQIELDTVVWTRADKYQVTYWKRLPDVHVVRFYASLTGRSRVAAWPRAVEPKWFTTWWVAKGRWYKSPWEMDGWPPEMVPHG